MSRARRARQTPVADPMPEFLPPMKPALVTKAPLKGEWLSELKWDGYWMEATVSEGNVVLRSSSGADWTQRFGRQIAAACSALQVSSAKLHGEVVLLAADGTNDFAGLHALLRARRPLARQTARLTAVIFDLLYLDGHDVTRAPQVERRRLLQKVMATAQPPLAFSETFDTNPEALFGLACEKGLEGVVLKRSEAVYQAGRASSWLKIKCVQEEPVVIGGWLPAAGPLSRVGALLVGKYDAAGRLHYIGRVGSGIGDAAAAELAERLSRRRAAGSPFRSGTMSGPTRRAARFVRPELVADIRVRGWTSDGKLRHPSYKSLRADKRPSAVKLEQDNESA